MDEVQSCVRGNPDAQGLECLSKLPVGGETEFMISHYSTNLLVVGTLAQAMLNCIVHSYHDMDLMPSSTAYRSSEHSSRYTEYRMSAIIT